MQLTEVEGIEDPFVEQNDRGAHADPDTANDCPLAVGLYIVFSRANLHDIGRRVYSGL